ncbi:MAG: DUF4349 domain-containing protein [Microcella sp.]|uniref:DUF4349 domain-containing protein n=1 Tax=Microcella sp. TaxID=1913979 RepID=UPI0024CA2BB9|nr:DUF4349 domain-containing protein [Microcella sp.]UYN83575.1 MAG: DUF4349 domain-containing protein [Microcella sp.]
MTTLRPRYALPALALAGLLLSGCAASGSTESMPDYDMSSDGGGLPQAPVFSEAGEDSSRELADDRSVITTGYLYVTVDAPLESATEAVAITEAAGGRVDARQEFAPNRGDAGGAQLTLRIPADRLTATLDRLRELGEVEELQLSSSDVTREVQDVDARVTALRSSITRLLALQDAAASVEDLIALETAISNRQAELESLEAQQRYLSDQVGLSTITLVLGSRKVAPVTEPDTFVTGLVAGWESLVAFGSGLLVLLGVLLPWLVLLGVLGLVILLIVRRARRTRSTSAASVVGGSADDGEQRVE